MTRVCVIGAGPSGMAAMYHFGQLGDSAPDVFCYETQTTWGGLWNYTWRTETDEMVSIAMVDGIGECGQIVPKGLWSYPIKRLSNTLKRLYRHISPFWYQGLYGSTESDIFTVVTKYFETNKDNSVERFSHLIVASSIVSTPFISDFDDPLCIEEKIPSLYPDNLYKGIVWLEGSNNKLLYIGAQRAVVSTPMFDI